MRLSQPITQGGQTFLHKWRMWQQIMRLAFFVSMMVGMLTFVGLSITCHPRHEVSCPLSRGQAKPERGDPFWRRTLMGPRLREDDKRRILQHAYLSLALGLLAGSTLFILWRRQGLQAHRKQTIAGLSFMPEKQVIRLIGKNKDASLIKLANLPLIKNCETQHTLITGTTGSGKTNAFKHIMQQIRPTNRAIILDTTGEFIDQFYDPTTDIIMNPFDERFPGWDLWQECQQPYHYDEVAESLIPLNASDPFWAQSSRTLLAEILKLLASRNVHSFAKTLAMANTMRLEELYDELKNTKAAVLIDPKSEKTATSIRMNLAANINSFEHLVGLYEKPFSIRNWVQDSGPPTSRGRHPHESGDSGWLFLTMNPAQRSTLRPLLSCWLSIAIKSLMELPPNSNNRLWFMIDELPSLHKLPDLPLCLAEGRKYGACMVLGLQNISQIEGLYGPHITQSLLDLCSTKIIFRSASFTMAQKLSHLLGTQERKEIQEGISYGANEIRDGVSLNVHTTEKPIIPPYDLMNLPDLSSYIQLPKNYPLTKIKWAIIQGNHEKSSVCVRA